MVLAQLGATVENRIKSVQLMHPGSLNRLQNFTAACSVFFIAGGELICIFQVNIVILVIMSTNSKFVKDVE